MKINQLSKTSSSEGGETTIVNNNNNNYYEENISNFISEDKSFGSLVEYKKTLGNLKEDLIKLDGLSVEYRRYIPRDFISDEIRDDKIGSIVYTDFFSGENEFGQPNFETVDALQTNGLVSNNINIFNTQNIPGADQKMLSFHDGTLDFAKHSIVIHYPEFILPDPEADHYPSEDTYKHNINNQSIIIIPSDIDGNLTVIFKDLFDNSGSMIEINNIYNGIFPEDLIHYYDRMHQHITVDYENQKVYIPVFGITSGSIRVLDLKNRQLLPSIQVSNDNPFGLEDFSYIGERDLRILSFNHYGSYDRIIFANFNSNNLTFHTISTDGSDTLTTNAGNISFTDQFGQPVNEPYSPGGIYQTWNIEDHFGNKLKIKQEFWGSVRRRYNIFPMLNSRKHFFNKDYIHRDVKKTDAHFNGGLFFFYDTPLQLDPTDYNPETENDLQQFEDNESSTTFFASIFHAAFNLSEGIKIIKKNPINTSYMEATFNQGSYISGNMDSRLNNYYDVSQGYENIKKRLSFEGILTDFIRGLNSDNDGVVIVNDLHSPNTALQVVHYGNNEMFEHLYRDIYVLHSHYGKFNDVSQRSPDESIRFFINNPFINNNGEYPRGIEKNTLLHNIGFNSNYMNDKTILKIDLSNSVGEVLPLNFNPVYHYVEKFGQNARKQYTTLFWYELESIGEFDNEINNIKATTPVIILNKPLLDSAYNLSEYYNGIQGDNNEIGVYVKTVLHSNFHNYRY